MVLPRTEAQPDSGGLMAARPNGAPGLLFGRTGSRPLRSGEVAGSVVAVLGWVPRRMGRLPRVCGRGAVFHTPLPLGEKAHFLAFAQPPPRRPYFYPGNPPPPSGRDGADHALRAWRTICRLRGHRRKRRAATKLAGH